jgi:hypothetical protein
MSWEEISGLCAIIGVIFLIYQYVYLLMMEKEEVTNSLLAQLNTARWLVEKLINELTEYAEVNGSMNSLFIGPLTFRAQIAHLQHLRDTELDAHTRESFVKLKLSKIDSEGFITGLNNHILSLNQIESYFFLTFKQGLVDLERSPSNVLSIHKQQN